MPLDAAAHLRVARPSLDLAAAERFWVSGLGLDVLHRHTTDGSSPGEHSLLMVGWPAAPWHLELVHDPADPVEPRPTPEDLLVIYLGEPVPDPLVARLARHGGRRVPAHNPYWDTWGVTVLDPDGYPLVLSTRGWSNA
ncbi:VOC family protein [Streptomyces hainanensis]|uniref:VOC family protein n=1 Tax=Streptomyces hainanensis TaxID=402648 RepID=A0A4R4SV53_9ACTN|nr:VOC family protein [Streptomyces hainanensis]TDC68068.1 VOC family protein [Streptomyces hainanensis]